MDVSFSLLLKRSFRLVILSLFSIDDVFLSLLSTSGRKGTLPLTASLPFSWDSSSNRSAPALFSPRGDKNESRDNSSFRRSVLKFIGCTGSHDDFLSKSINFTIRRRSYASAFAGRNCECSVKATSVVVQRDSTSSGMPFHFSMLF